MYPVLGRVAVLVAAVVATAALLTASPPIASLATGSVVQSDQLEALSVSNVQTGDDRPGAGAPTAFTAVSAGGDHSCALRSDGSVVCWGDNLHGQATAPSGTFTQVSAGSWHSCGLRTDGSIVCWGQNEDGEATAPSGSFTYISAGVSRSCAVRTSGSIVCWGAKDPSEATAPSGSFSQVVAGNAYSCGLRTDGTVNCWGLPDEGTISGRFTPSGSFTAVSGSCGLRTDGTIICWGNHGNGEPVPPGSFTQISTGSAYSCGLRNGGSLVCWGWNRYGQATAPSGLFAAVSAGPQHACGLRSDGNIDCWGKNTRGQVIAPSGSFTQVSAGYGQSCVLRTDGTIHCWGEAAPTDSGIYEAATAPPGSFTQVSAGHWYGCGLRTDGTIDCWGQNDSGQAAAPSGSFTGVSTGAQHACGLRTDGTIVCWGDTFTYYPTAAVAPPGPFTEIWAGTEDGTACVRWTEGSIFCWDGETVTAPSGMFTQVSGDSQSGCGLRPDGTIDCWGLNERIPNVFGPFTAVSAGPGYTCALKANRNIHCTSDIGAEVPPPAEIFVAGSGYDDTTGFNDSCEVRTDGSITCWGKQPATAPPGSFTHVSAGYEHSCGVRSDSSIVCWGDNPYSVETLERLEENPPSGPFTQVSASLSSQCGLRTDGTIVCWGDNDSGQATAPSGTFTQVSASHWYGCGLRTDGTIVCWGDNDSGQATAPSGTFTDVSTSAGHSCGVRTGGSVECWGGSPLVLAAGPDSGDRTVGGQNGGTVPDPGEDAGVHQPSIDALVREVPGIFNGTGCDQGLCPGEPLQRWEMAVWLVRVLDRANPAARSSTRFADVDAGMWWASYTDRLAELEVTDGCATGPWRFCPERAVNRAQMAAFLVRAFELDEAPSAGYADTSGHYFESGIDKLAAARITLGCTADPPSYCPEKPVTRAEMATFLARALDLV